jgi:heat shock protein HslJ
MLLHHVRGLLAALLLFTTIAACAMSSGTDPAAKALTALPDGTRWQLQDTSIATLQTPEASEVTLNIEAGRLHGNSGCNQYSAGFRFEGERVVLEPVAATKRGCIGPAGTIESAFFAALRQLQGFSRDGDLLVMRLADGGHLSFRPSPLATK